MTSGTIAALAQGECGRPRPYVGHAKDTGDTIKHDQAVEVLYMDEKYFA